MCPVSSFPNFSQLVRNLMLTKCRYKHHCIQPPLFFRTLMYEQTPLFIHPHTHFPGVKPSHTHLSSFPAFLTAFPPPVRSRHSYLGNAFLDRTNTRPNPKPPHARVRSLLMPESEASLCPKAKRVPGSYLKTKEVS